MAAFTLGQAVAAPIWGRVSDAKGRRLVLILTMFGSAIAYVLLAIADSLWLVIASRVLGGLMAGNIATAFAYVADITTDENRPAGLGKVGAAMGLGFIFGPAIGGLLAGADVATANFVAPALAAAAMSVLAMFGTLLFLPESLPEASRRPMLGARLRDVEGEASLSALNRSGLLKLMIAALAFYTGMAQMESIFPLWAKDVFGLGPRNIGIVFFVLGTITVVMQGGLIGPLSRQFGERALAVAAGVFFALGLTGFALATQPWHLWAALFPFGIGAGLFNPVVSSLVSKTASASERGVIMGRYQSASASGRVIGPILCGPLYSFVGTGAPFLLGAAIMMPVLALLLRFRLQARPAPGARAKLDQ
jgi:MFS family permease